MEIEADMAVYGGSFNPPHNGHYFLIKYILATSLKKIIIMPAYSPPHKPNEDIMVFRHRFAMLRLLLSRFLERDQQSLNKRIKLSILEKKLPLPSYTYQTLEALKEICPNKKIAVVIGADMYYTLKSWHNYQELLKKYSFVVFKRTTKNKWQTGLEGVLESSKICFLDNPLWDFNSSDIRKKLKGHSRNKNRAISEQLRTMLPIDIINYILRNNLY